MEKLENQRTKNGIPYRIGPERKVPDSSVTRVTEGKSELKKGDSTDDSVQSPSVTSVTAQSPENDHSPVESDSGDSSDSTIPLLSSEVQIPMIADGEAETHDSVLDYQQHGH